MNLSAMTDKLKQYPLAVLCGGLLIVFIVIIFLRGGVASDLSVEESDLNSRIRTIEQNTKNSNNLKRDAEDLNVIVEQIDARLFDRDERAININFFYAVEDRVDVVVSGISQLPQEDPIYAKGGPRELKLHSTLVYNISLNGSFENILRFFYELYRVDPLIRVADYQLSAARGVDADPDQLEARVRVLVFAQKD